jgi:hypothetical protein
VLARVRVEAGIGKHKALHRLPADDVRFDDLVHICLGDVSIPHPLGVNYDIRAVLTLIETTRLVGPHSAFEPSLRQLLLEEFLQLRLAAGIATSPGISRRPLVTAYKDVLLELGHDSHLNLSDFALRVAIRHASAIR